MADVDNDLGMNASFEPDDLGDVSGCPSKHSKGPNPR